MSLTLKRGGFVLGLPQRALQGKAWSTLQIIWETSQDYTTVLYRIECLNE